MRSAFALVHVVAACSAILVLQSCAADVPVVVRAVAVADTCPSDDGAKRFIPTVGIGRGVATEKVLVPLFSGFLDRAAELPLWCGASLAQDVYRTLVIPSNDPAFLVTVERSSDGSDPRVSYVEFESPRGRDVSAFRASAVKKRSNRLASDESVNEAVRQLEAAGFWSGDAGATGADDATQILIEARVDRRYRALAIEGQETPLRNAAFLIAALSGKQYASDLPRRQIPARRRRRPCLRTLRYNAARAPASRTNGPNQSGYVLTVKGG
jgi:hypothetical protein